MLRRISICGVALALAAPVSAQQQTPQEPNQAAIKFQVRNFESTLKMAVVRGGTEVADKVRDIVPGVDLQFLTDVGVSGWWTADFGYTFDVVIPEIGATVAQLIRNIQQQSAAAPVRPVAGSAGSGRVAGTASGAAPDRMINSPVAPFDPGVELGVKVRQALIDALIDNSAALQLSPGQRLVISAGPGPQLVPTSLGQDSRKLILSVKSEDLIRFRKLELKREELLALIKESRF